MQDLVTITHTEVVGGTAKSGKPMIINLHQVDDNAAYIDQNIKSDERYH
jgi:hypothetical protein